jgi:hypothetical protein
VTENRVKLVARILINLFGDTNVARILYKSSLTCGTKTENDKYMEKEGHYYTTDLSSIAQNVFSLGDFGARD